MTEHHLTTFFLFLFEKFFFCSINPTSTVGFFILEVHEEARSPFSFFFFFLFFLILSVFKKSFYAKKTSKVAVGERALSLEETRKTDFFFAHFSKKKSSFFSLSLFSPLPYILTLTIFFIKHPLFFSVHNPVFANLVIHAAKTLPIPFISNLSGKGGIKPPAVSQMSVSKPYS